MIFKINEVNLYKIAIFHQFMKQYMKFLSLFVFLLVFSNSGYSQQDTVNPNGYNVFHYPNGFKLSEGNMLNGKPDGYWTTFYVNGNKKSEGNRKNFMLDSLWIFYAANGDTTETINYLQGTKNGVYSRYFTTLDSGVNVIKSQELFLNDQRQGYSFYFYTNGQIHYKIKYKDNVKNGEGYEYSPNGTLIAIEQYRNNNLISRRAVNRVDVSGQRTGVWVDVYTNGKVKSEVNYINGLPNGTYKEFSQTGNVLQVKTFDNGLVVSQIDNPTIRDTLKVKNLRVETDFYPNGKIKFMKTYNDSIPFGSHIFYDQAGNITKAEIYNEYGLKTAEGKLDTLSEKQGTWTLFFDDGQIQAVGEYKNNLKTGEWEYFYENGALRQKGAYKDNFSDGKWLWYYDNGNILREENYILGEIVGVIYELDIHGDTIAKGKYTQNVKHGKWFYKIGDEYETGNYYFGRKRGEWLTYYYPDMKLKSVSNYTDGRKTGKFKSYYSNKKIKEIGQYENDNKSGKWTYYTSDGNIDYTAEYSRGKLIKVNDYNID